MVFHRRAFGTSLSFSELEVSVATNGTRVVTVRGLGSEQSEMLEKVAEGAARGARK